MENTTKHPIFFDEGYCNKSQVNIYGNYNDMNINQAQNAESGIDGGDYGGNSYHDVNPRCLDMCNSEPLGKFYW
jgi:hypothetical protein